MPSEVGLWGIPIPWRRSLCLNFRSPRRSTTAATHAILDQRVADASADLYPKCGQPAYVPWRLALVTLMQFREGLSDRQAADSVRARFD